MCPVLARDLYNKQVKMKHLRPGMHGAAPLKSMLFEASIIRKETERAGANSSVYDYKYKPGIIVKKFLFIELNHTYRSIWIQ